MYILNPLNWNWYLSDLTGLAGLALALAFTIVLSLRYPRLSTILTIAFLARMAGALFNHYIRPLPDAGDDAIAFETRAWEWAELGLDHAIASFGEQGISWMYSHIGSFIYLAVGRSPLLLQSFSIMAGVFTVVLAWRIALTIWNDPVFARKVAWVAAVFPTLILYSSVTMREPFITLLFVMTIWYTVRWAQTGLMRYAVIAVGVSGLQVFFHAGMVLAAVALVGFIAWEMTRDFLIRFFDKGYILIIPGVLISSAVIVLSIFWYSFIGVSIPYIGTVAGVFDVAVILRQATNVAVEAGSAWPAFLLPTSLPGVIIVTPLRMLYFMFSPFPWDVRAASHIIGLIDAILYMIIAAAIWRNRAALWANRATRVILLMLIPLILAFAWGTGNAGTAVRHRSKLIIALVMLAGSYLPRIKYGSR